MPGVLLTEAMAQSSGWLLLGVMKFERMPFLAIVKEAKMRGFVSPGELLTIEAKVEHEGSGFAVTKAKVRVGKELRCSADITFGLAPFPDPACACTWTRWPARSASHCRRLRMTEPKSEPNPQAPRKSGSPASASSPRSAKGWTRIGTR